MLIGKKQVDFAAEEETIEPEPESEEGVFYIDRQGYWKFGWPQGNFSGNKFTGNYSSSGYTLKPAFQKTFPQNNFQMTYGNSAYQTPLPPSAKSKIEYMLEQILEGQSKLVVEFNGKFVVVYTYLNGKIENQSSHMKKLDV